MDIGTAKPTIEEMENILHHMLSVAEPWEDFSVGKYCAMATPIVDDILARGKTAIIVGGTGLYMDALIRGNDFAPVPSTGRREELEKIAAEKGIEAVIDMLRAVDPESAEAIHKNNIRRVVRALEIYDTTGKTKSYFDKLSKTVSADISVGMITLDFHNRENLYSRVDKRVDIMIREGLVDEVRSLYEGGRLIESTTAAQAIGYKELVLYLKGEISLAEATELIKLSTRRYAKRQLTWFRHEGAAYRLYIDSADGKMRDVSDIIDEGVFAAKDFLKEITEK